jgi:hypothetical protein
MSDPVDPAEIIADLLCSTLMPRGRDWESARHPYIWERRGLDYLAARKLAGDRPPINAWTAWLVEEGYPPQKERRPAWPILAAGIGRLSARTGGKAGMNHIDKLFAGHRHILDEADGGYLCDMAPAAVKKFIAAVLAVPQISITGCKFEGAAASKFYVSLATGNHAELSGHVIKPMEGWS